MQAGRRSRRALAFLAGSALVLTQPPLSVALLLLPLIAALFRLWTLEPTWRGAFWTGWWAGLGYFGFGLYWIGEAFLVEADQHAWLIPVALPALAGGLALFWGTGFAAARWIVAPRQGGAIAFATLWMTAEALRGVVFTGFPWALPGYGWIETPLVQTVAWIGINGLTLLTLLAGALLGRALLNGDARPRALAGVSAILIVAGLWVAGKSRLSDGDAAEHTGLLVGIVQPNVAQRDKWRPELRERHLRHLIAQTRKLSDDGAAIMVWPEAATAYPIAEMADIRAMIADALGPRAMLLTGAIRVSGRGTPDAMAYNSVLVIGPDGTQRAHYDKQHLVPFGEYLPFDAALTRLGVRAIASLPGGLSAGDAEVPRRIAVPGLPPFAAMICYEAIFPHEIADRNSDIAWLAHVTNDAWFGATAGPYQHLAQARVRAIERGVPIVRAANTGISAMIDARGSVLEHIPLGRSGTMVHPLPVAGAPTLYHRREETVFLTMMALLLGFNLATLRMGKLNRKDKAA